MINQYQQQKNIIITNVYKRLFLPKLKKLSFEQLEKNCPDDLTDAIDYVSSIFDLPREDIREIFQNNKKTNRGNPRFFIKK